MCINQGLKRGFFVSITSGRVLVSFGRMQYRSRTNFRTTDNTKLSTINQQKCCSVPFLLSQHSSAGIGIGLTSGPRSYIPIETSNDSDNSHFHLFIDSHKLSCADRHPQFFFLSDAAANNYQAMNTLAPGN